MASEPVPEPEPEPGERTLMHHPDRFDHDNLDVYKAAIEFVALADSVVEHLPRGRAHLADQLHRASTSIALNIAEGAGEYARNEKHRFYRMARPRQPSVRPSSTSAQPWLLLMLCTSTRVDSCFYGSLPC